MAEAVRTERVEKAIGLHLSGCNCAQAVARAFADMTGLTESLLMRAASDMGGGLSGTHELCGAVSAMVMVLGLIRGYDDPRDTEGKQRLYREGRALIEDFTAEFGTLNCMELTTKVAPAYRENRHPLVTEEFPRPCSQFVAYAAAILDAFLAEKSTEND